MGHLLAEHLSAVDVRCNVEYEYSSFRIVNNVWPKAEFLKEQTLADSQPSYIHDSIVAYLHRVVQPSCDELS
jgi:hypothetical protein